MATTVVRFSALAQGSSSPRSRTPGPRPSRGLDSPSRNRAWRCHEQGTPGIVAQWKDSGHPRAGVGCFDCHQASEGDADAFDHQGVLVATVVTPRDCGRCHKQEDAEFEGSHHAKAGNILASLDNYLAETVEGARTPFDPHSATPDKDRRTMR